MGELKSKQISMITLQTRGNKIQGDKFQIVYFSISGR